MRKLIYGYNRIWLSLKNMNLYNNVKVVIPAFNEAANIALVINDIPPQLCTEVIVTNNNSTDNTAAIAKQCNATVLQEPTPGYGIACLKALDYIRQTGGCDVVVFVDADYSDYPSEMAQLLAPIQLNTADMVIGARVKKLRAVGSMTPQQIFGNWLAVFLINLFYKHQFTDLGPFRAITWQALESLQMVDKNYGWTVEMQIKAIKKNLRCTEIPVKYRNRNGGVSKVSGSLKGSVLAGIKIIKTIFKYA